MRTKFGIEGKKCGKCNEEALLFVSYDLRSGFDERCEHCGLISYFNRVGTLIADENYFDYENCTAFIGFNYKNKITKIIHIYNEDDVIDVDKEYDKILSYDELENIIEKLLILM